VLPFFAFVGAALILPILFICWQAFRRTTQGEAKRDPVTQQFIHTSHTTFTVDNVHESLTGISLTSMRTSVELSLITAVLAAVIGLALAFAVSRSPGRVLKPLVTTAAAVTANFGGIPLAFLFIATLDANAGIFTRFLQDHFGFSLADNLGFELGKLAGITVVYLYFLVPLMVLVMMPSIEGVKEQWSEAAENLGATKLQYLRWVVVPVLLPSFLGAVLLLFCAAFSAYATAYAINSSFPLVTIRIASVLSGNVLSGQENLGAALALDMIVIVLPLTVLYQLLQRRTSRWLS
jgi:putative spermidine/putrescine transport system permease protein